MCAQAAQIGHAGAGPGSSNGRIAGVAAKALPVDRGLIQRLARGLVELDHGFAQGHDVEGFGEVCHANKAISNQRAVGKSKSNRPLGEWSNAAWNTILY
jgi:hypothetical protein